MQSIKKNCPFVVAVNHLARKTGISGIIGRSFAIRSQAEKVLRYALYDAAVLIFGETGTGKEVFARAIHCAGARASHPFLPVNCPAIPTELVENELFGHYI